MSSELLLKLVASLGDLSIGKLLAVAAVLLAAAMLLHGGKFAPRPQRADDEAEDPKAKKRRLSKRS